VRAVAVESSDVLQQAQARVRRAYGEALGRSVHDVITPALVLDLGAAHRNIRRMADRMRGLPADLRPHVKVHKSPQLARMQLQAGANGLSTATVWEAIAMVRSGLDGIFVVNTVAGREKIGALAALAGSAEVMVAVDDSHNGAHLSEAATAAGTELDVAIEFDTGMDRAGVDSVEEAVTLAKQIAGLDGLRFQGLTGYEGHCSMTPERELRHQRQRAAMDLLVAAADAIVASGLPCPIVSAGGSATWEWTASHPGITEVQAGSYAVMDNFHAAIVDGEFEHAVSVLSTVISRRPDRVIVDAGNKSIGLPDLATIKGHDLPVFRSDEEHGIFVASPDTALRVGAVVELVPGYAPATVNWYDAYHVVEDEQVVDIWPVLPRGPGHGGLL
jgi:D-serine deaminase-like pyridoxal phosphate-dependent protein